MSTEPHDMRCIPDRSRRRGNALVLVAGLLALLVIVATAFIARTQGGRQTAVAVQRAQQRGAASRDVGEQVAQHLADALFARPIDPPIGPGAGNDPRDANRLRLAPSADALRYSVDRDELNNQTFAGVPDGVPDYPFNFAPYEVVPWTNWPDEWGVAPPLSTWPRGDGAPNGAQSLWTDNPVGNPGQGDSRWLRDFEPLRWDAGGGSPLHDTFRFWQHLTNLSRDDNGWRIVRDVANVYGATDGNGAPNGGVIPNILLDLNLPVEQWLRSVPPDQLTNYRDAPPAAATGFAFFPGANTFWSRWLRWFDSTPATGYGLAYRNAALVPPNLYDLNDLDGDGIRLEAGERPQDEFVRGTARWNVSRILADTDGDGLTDAFWHLVPGPVTDGVRHVAAVSVVDNGGMLNVNVATRFRPGTITENAAQRDVEFRARASAGETPADLALLGQRFANSNSDQPPGQLVIDPNWHVGFLDAIVSREIYMDFLPAQGNPFDPSRNDEIAWDSDQWSIQLAELGFDPSLDPESPFSTARDRRYWWYKSGSRGLAPQLDGFFTPFTLADEFELRAWHGQNIPWVYSRLERAVNDYDTAFGSLDPAPQFGFLRSATEYHQETNAFLDRLNANELLHDKRRMLTTYNGTRNELLPAWLRWRWDGAANGTAAVPAEVRQLAAQFPQDLDGNGRSDVLDRFYAQSLLKADLREQDPATLPAPPAGVLRLDQRLPHLLLHVFSDGDEEKGDSYFGAYAAGSPDVDRLRRMAAGMSANILAQRDLDLLAPLDGDPTTPAIDPGPQGGAIPLPQWDLLPADWTERVLGLEPQPFLMEAFVGHFYELVDIPALGPAGQIFTDADDKIILETTDTGGRLSSSIVVVQIANPYPFPLPLVNDGSGNFRPYELRVFGQAVSLEQIALAMGVQYLPAATDDVPATMVIYSIEDSFRGDANFKNKIRNFLDIQPGDHPTGTLFADLYLLRQSNAAIVPWRTNRLAYDNSGTSHSIELARYDGLPLAGPPATAVVIDRAEADVMDPESFAFQVRLMGETGADACSGNRPPRFNQLTIPDPPYTGPFPCSNRWSPKNAAGFMNDRTHWMQWRRWTRAWGHDHDGDRIMESNERNPRFVAGIQTVTFPINAHDYFANPSVGLPGGPYAPYPVDSRLEKLFPPSTSIPPVGGWLVPPAQGETARGGNLFNYADDPDQATDFFGQPGVPRLAWFTHVHWEELDVDGSGGVDPTEVFAFHRRPTFFDHNRANDPAQPGGWSYPDKGYYAKNNPTAVSGLRFANQMLAKNEDFRQVGELLNVWLWGHVLEFSGAPLANGIYVKTKETFSEQLADTTLSPRNLRHGRMQLDDEVIGQKANNGPPNLRELAHAVPDLLAAHRLLEAFVCDGPGVDYDPDDDLYEDFAFNNALGYAGRITPGLVNINTAPLEVLRTIPHWYKFVHADAESPNPAQPHASFARSAIAEAAISYRERLWNETATNAPFDRSGFSWLTAAGPNYRGGGDGDRDDDVRGSRGFAAIGELLALDRPGATMGPNPAQFPDLVIRGDNWRIDAARRNPFQQPTTQFGAWLSTDVSGFNPNAFNGDGVAGDVEEANLLVAGASNLVSTRSDVFTVYLRLRSFRQNPSTGFWDATDPEQIVDDARYVMLVDRGDVNRPGDQPKILLFQRLPN